MEGEKAAADDTTFQALEKDFQEVYLHQPYLIEHSFKPYDRSC